MLEFATKEQCTTSAELLQSHRSDADQDDSEGGRRLQRLASSSASAGSAKKLASLFIERSWVLTGVDLVSGYLFALELRSSRSGGDWKVLASLWGQEAVESACLIHRLLSDLDHRHLAFRKWEARKQLSNAYSRLQEQAEKYAELVSGRREH